MVFQTVDGVRFGEGDGGDRIGGDPCAGTAGGTQAPRDGGKGTVEAGRLRILRKTNGAVVAEKGDNPLHRISP